MSVIQVMMMVMQRMMVDRKVVCVSGHQTVGWIGGRSTSCLLLACNEETVEVEFVNVAFAVHFGHDVLVVVISGVINE